jgi:hypothetical protein
MASGSTLVLQSPAITSPLSSGGLGSRSGDSCFNMLATQLSMATSLQHSSSNSRSVAHASMVAHSTPIRSSNSKSNAGSKSMNHSRQQKKVPVGQKRSNFKQPMVHNTTRNNSQQSSRNNRTTHHDDWSSGSSDSTRESPTFSIIQSPVENKRTSRNGQNTRQNRSANKSRQNKEDSNLARKLGLSFQNNSNSNNNHSNNNNNSNKKQFATAFADNKLPSSKSNFKKQQTEENLKYIRSINKNSSITNVKNLDNWGTSCSGLDTANKHNKKTSNNTKNSGYNRDHNSSYTCQSDSNSSSKNNNSNNNFNGNNSDGYQGQTQSNRSYIRVATLHEASTNVNDSFATSLNAYNSNSNNKITSNTSKKNSSFISGQNNNGNHGNTRNRNRNSNSFSKTSYNNNSKPVENSRFAGYAASPDATTLPQPPKNWLTDSIKQQKLYAISSSGSKTDSCVNINMSHMSTGNYNYLSSSSGNRSSQYTANKLADKLSNSISLSENDATSTTTTDRHHSKKLFANFKPEELDASNFSSS